MEMFQPWTLAVLHGLTSSFVVVVVVIVVVIVAVDVSKALCGPTLRPSHWPPSGRGCRDRLATTTNQ